MKHKSKTLLIIAAVAVMPAGATSAHAYYERWDGWFNSGYLMYNDDTYNYTSGSGTLEDYTSGDDDMFAIYAVPVSTFTCSTTGYYIRLWVHTTTGSKPTGQEDQKEVDDGATWIGNAILYRPYPLTNVVFDTVWGTWNTRAAGDYFDYDPETPTYSAAWVATLSSPGGITGAGGSLGDRIYYDD